MKNYKFQICAILLLLGTLNLFSCKDDEKNDKPDVVHTEYAKISYSDLQLIDGVVKGMQIPLPEFDIKRVTDSLVDEGLSTDDIYLRVIKVSHKLANPNKQGGYIDNSGVVLVPSPRMIPASHDSRLVVMPLGAFVGKETAPSEFYKSIESALLEENVSMVIVSSILALNNFAVLLPDYPGYGDSYKQCSMPIMETAPLVSSVIGLTKATRSTLTSYDYKYKSDIALAGYSLGGHVSGTVARELETNLSHNLNAGLLFIGGANIDLKYLADTAKRDENAQAHLILPWMLSAFKANGYPNLNLSDVMKEPYDTKTIEYFDGSQGVVEVVDLFPEKNTDLYTEKYIKDTGVDFNYLNEVLAENSLEPWKNKCTFFLTHSVDDNTTYFYSAEKFAKRTNEIGGEIEFIPTAGEHNAGANAYMTMLVPHILNQYK